jgi:hypothetical protein
MSRISLSHNTRPEKWSQNCITFSTNNFSAHSSSQRRHCIPSFLPPSFLPPSFSLSPLSIPSPLRAGNSRNRNNQIGHATPEILSRKRHIRTLINIQAIRARAPAALLGRHLRLAEVKGAGGRARIDDLHRDGVADAADGGAIEAALVSNGEAFPAVGGAAGGAYDAGGGGLAIAVDDGVLVLRDWKGENGKERRAHRTTARSRCSHHRWCP